MLRFYKKSILIFFGLLLFTLVSGFICFERVFIKDTLLPAGDSVIPWKTETITDVGMGGSSSVSVTEHPYNLNYEYHLTEDFMFPYVIIAVAFDELEQAKNPVDLSKYSTATFGIKCTPINSLVFNVHMIDEKITVPGIFDTYRIAAVLFPCHEEWSDVKIDLRQLDVPQWWLESMNADIFDKHYRLDKVIAIGFAAMRQGPLNTLARVKISKLTLHGRDWRYAWVFAGFAVLVWGGFIVWFVKKYTLNVIANAQEKLGNGQPFMAYRQLSIEPYRDKEKSQVLQFMATEYANPDLSLESVIATLGINRTKINELLKDELNMTFSTYLRKLRLAEAARLLSQRDDASVTQIASSVGYRDVSYFRKLFKNEYGSTPGAFKDIHTSKRSE